MPDPRIPQGFLNRLNSAVYFNDVPQLNISPSFLGKAGISLSFGSKATTSIPTMAGRVQSPEPYLEAMLTIDLLRTQSLASSWKSRIESNTILGDCVVYPDVAAGQGGIGVFNLLNCAIEDPPNLAMNGTDPSFRLTVSAYYDINSTLWGGG
jgi:hypothetical protein